MLDELLVSSFRIGIVCFHVECWVMCNHCENIFMIWKGQGTIWGRGNADIFAYCQEKLGRDGSMISQQGRQPQSGSTPTYYLVKFSCKCIKMIKFVPRGKAHLQNFTMQIPHCLVPVKSNQRKTRSILGWLLKLFSHFFPHWGFPASSMQEYFELCVS